MFVNCSNHDSSKWSKKQKEAAEKYGEIYDLPFPNVPASASEEEVTSLAEDVTGKIFALNPDAVMCQGEFTLTYRVVKKLTEAGISVMAACSERMVTEKINENGETEKVVQFEFVKFRGYI